MHLKEQPLTIIESWVVSPFPQETENLASQSHETKRISDPYVFVIDQDKLKTPGGITIEEVIEKNGHLGKIEAEAFGKIQNWASQNSQGQVIWISPPYPGEYPVSKMVVSEIISTSQNQKILLNRAIVLDIEEKSCLEIAQHFGVFTDTEGLRETPIFFDHEDYSWINVIKKYTDQTEKITNTQDINLKNDTYLKANQITKTVYLARQNGRLQNSFEMAKQQGLIGEHQESCPSQSKTAFKVMSNESKKQETKILRCTCPVCKAQVSATISGGRIHCPNCGASATYSC